MATTWGQFSWGSNSWQSNQNNITPSSFSLSAELGTVHAESSVGWGAKSWGAGEWGTLRNAIVLQGGLSLSANIESVTVTSEINIGWGGLAWNEGEWGDLANPNINLTGQALTISQGEESITADGNVSVTGIESNLTLQGVVAGTSAEVTTGSLTLAISQTSVFAGELVVVEVTSPCDDPWGNTLVGWGNGFWGVGDGLTFVGETAAGQANANVDVTGQELQSTVEQVNAGISQLIILSNTLPEQAVLWDAKANAQISTDQSKFGGSSLELDGSSDRIQSTDVTLGTDSYTFETFARFDSFASTQCLWDAGENVGSSQNPVVYITSTNLQLSYAGGTYINAAHGMSTDTWHHIAIVRNGTNLAAYIDGTSIGTATYAGGSGATNHVLGGNFAGTFTMNGYLDESRLTKRVIYTGNFTPPTSAFSPDTTNDIWLNHYDGTDGSTDIVNSVITTQMLGTFSIGDHFAGEVVEVQVTTASTQPWGELAWGDGQWGQSVGTDISQGGEEVATPSIEVDVTGISLNSNIGSLAITGHANISLTGIASDIQLGNEDAFTNVRVGVSGLELGPIVIGDYLPGINADVTLTGVTATPNTGTIGLNAWAVVDPGTSPTWTVVDKAA